MYLASPNKQYKLWMQSDGHLVLYCYAHGYQRVQWASGVYGFRPTNDGLMFQNDGNLVIYGYVNNIKTPLWSTNTPHNTASERLVVQDDGNLVLYGKRQGHVIWVTWTQNRCGRKRRDVYQYLRGNKDQKPISKSVSSLDNPLNA